MINIKRILLIIAVLIIIGCAKQSVLLEGEEISLPKPKLDSGFSIEKALSERRAVRNFKNEALSLEEISQLLWAAQGIDAITGATRTAPSAGATQPLEIYLIVKNVKNLEQVILLINQ